MQLSFIPVLEEARFRPAPANEGLRPANSLDRTISPPRLSNMARVNRPTQAQVDYLKKLTRIRTDTQLNRYVLRKLGKVPAQTDAKTAPVTLTKADFAKVIDMEISEKRLAG